MNVVESWKKCLENVEVGGDLLGATELRKFRPRGKVTRKQKLPQKNFGATSLKRSFWPQNFEATSLREAFSPEILSDTPKPIPQFWTRDVMYCLMIVALSLLSKVFLG